MYKGKVKCDPVSCNGREKKEKNETASHQKDFLDFLKQEFLSLLGITNQQEVIRQTIIASWGTYYCNKDY